MIIILEAVHFKQLSLHKGIFSYILCSYMLSETVCEMTCGEYEYECVVEEIVWVLKRMCN